MIKSFDLALIKETMEHCVNEERALPLKRFINFLFFFWLYSFLILGFFLYHVFHIPFSSLGFFCTSSFHVPFLTLDFYGIIFSLNLCAWFFNVNDFFFPEIVFFAWNYYGISFSCHNYLKIFYRASKCIRCSNSTIYSVALNLKVKSHWIIGISYWSYVIF